MVSDSENVKLSLHYIWNNGFLKSTVQNHSKCIRITNSGVSIMDGNSGGRPNTPGGQSRLQKAVPINFYSVFNIMYSQLRQGSNLNVIHDF